MFCNKCGAKLNDSAKFCNQCGNEVASLQDNTNKHTVVIEVSDSLANFKKFFKQYKSKIIKYGILITLAITLIVFLSSPALMLRAFYWYMDPVIETRQSPQYNANTQTVTYKSYTYGSGGIADFKKSTVYVNDYDFKENYSNTSWRGNNEFDYVYKDSWEILDDNTLVIDDEEYEWKEEWDVTPWKLTIGDKTFYPIDVFGYEFNFFKTYNEKD